MRKDYIPPIDMYVHFEYASSNPYISFTYSKLFDMLTRYVCEQTAPKMFKVVAPARWVQDYAFKTPYALKKAQLRCIAKDWQAMFSELTYSQGDLLDWQWFFEEYGRRYGLLTEFRENGIC